jgi:hypothetical protein
MAKSAQQIDAAARDPDFVGQGDELQGIDGDSQGWRFGDLNIGDGATTFCQLLDTRFTILRAEGRAYATISYLIQGRLGWYTRKAFVKPPGGLGIRVELYTREGNPLDKVVFPLEDQWCHDDKRPVIMRVEMDPIVAAVVGRCMPVIDETKSWHRCGLNPAP